MAGRLLDRARSETTIILLSSEIPTVAHLDCKDLLNCKEWGQCCEAKVIVVEIMMKVMMMGIAGNCN